MRFFGFLDRMAGAVGSWLQSPLLLALRLFFGIGFMIAAFGKFQDIGKFQDLLLTSQVPYPEISAWAAALTEFIGGFFLAIGFLSRLVAIPLIIVMLTAYATVHVESVHHILSDPNNFVSQGPFNFLLTALLVFAFGPGCLSVDGYFGCNKGKKTEERPAQK